MSVQLTSNILLKLQITVKFSDFNCVSDIGNLQCRNVKQVYLSFSSFTTIVSEATQPTFLNILLYNNEFQTEVLMLKAFINNACGIWGCESNSLVCMLVLVDSCWWGEIGKPGFQWIVSTVLSPQVSLPSILLYKICYVSDLKHWFLNHEMSGFRSFTVLSCRLGHVHCLSCMWLIIINSKFTFS